MAIASSRCRHGSSVAESIAIRIAFVKPALSDAIRGGVVTAVAGESDGDVRAAAVAGGARAGEHSRCSEQRSIACPGLAALMR